MGRFPTVVGSILRILSASLLGFFLFLPLARAQSKAGPDTGRRFALVIGNTNYSYPWKKLRNPGYDAELIADSLTTDKFELFSGRALRDASLSQMRAAISDFANVAHNADVIFFYYAGHGFQASGKNWLVPINANITTTSKLEEQAIDADWIVSQFDRLGSKLNIIVLDACRTDPADHSISATSPIVDDAPTRSHLEDLLKGNDGFAEMRPPRGTLIGFSTAAGALASDGYGQNGPYAGALSVALKRPGIDVLTLFNDVGRAVSNSTQNRQQPWLSISPIDSGIILSKAKTYPNESIYSKANMPISVLSMLQRPNASGECLAQSIPLRRMDGMTVCLPTLILDFGKINSEILSKPISTGVCKNGYTFYMDVDARMLCVVNEIYSADPTFKKVDPPPTYR